MLLPIDKFRRLILLFSGLMALAAAATTSAADISNPTGDSPILTRVTDNLYQFAHGELAGVVLVTAAGVIVVDPLDSMSTQWLQQELKNRFNQEVRYVVLSRVAPEGDPERMRLEGVELLQAAGAEVIAHENLLPDSGQPGSDDPLPAVVFSDTLSIVLGGLQVNLHYFGNSLTDDAIVAHFPAEAALYAGNIASVESLPHANLDSVSIPDWFSTIDKMNRIDFVYLLPAHNAIGIQNDAREHGYFLRELHNRVRRAIEDGKDLAETQETITMLPFRHWQQFDRLPDLIAAFYRQLSDS